MVTEREIGARLKGLIHQAKVMLNDLGYFTDSPKFFIHINL